MRNETRNQQGAYRARAWALTLALAAQVALAPYAHADDTVDSVCGSTLAQPAATASGTPTSSEETTAQKLQYCKAAQTAQDGSDADSALWKVWAAVGVVCTYACVASFTGLPTSEFICMGANVAAGVTDGIVTKNFTSAVMAIAGAGVGYGINKAVNHGAEEAAKSGAEKKPEKDIGACVNAAMAVFQSYTKHKAMTDNDQQVADNLKSAKSLQSTAEVATNSATTQTSSGTGTTAPATADALAGNSGSSLANPTATSSTTKVCGGSTAAATIQCAVASDKTLPAFVSSTKFPQEFQKDSGQSLAGFLGGNGAPGAQMAQAMSNGLDGGKTAAMAAAVEAVGAAVGPYDYSAGGTYASGGGGGGGGEAEAAPDMGAMMQGLMDQLNPNGKKKEEAATGVRAVIFANQNRAPASVAAIAEDRRLSLFDRVTYRYYYVGRRLVLGEGTTAPQ